jgi:glycosyltransferase involved in cell wall biosynthesis
MTCLHLDGTRWNPTLPMAVPALVAAVELTEPIGPIDGQGAVWAYLLVLAHGRPVGWVACPITNGECTPMSVRRAITASLAESTLSVLLAERLIAPVFPGTIGPDQLFAAVKHTNRTKDLFITVAVCTKDRPRDLERCLHSLQSLDYARFEVIVVDNASVSQETRILVESKFPTFRLVREERVGLNWARNCALSLAAGDVIAYTDDDAVADVTWLSRLAAVFEDRNVAAVTGLIAPYELRTEAQLHFEVIGGFGRGCRKAWYHVDRSGERPDVFHLGAGRFGAGANMAFRTSVLRDVGAFDEALDVGTPTEGGGDLELFFRLLHEGHVLVYEPAAVVWHRHRDNAAALVTQINSWGTAMGAFLTAAFLRYTGFRRRVVRFAMWWGWVGYFGPALRSLAGPGRAPRRVRFGPLRRLPAGISRYLKSRRQAIRLGAAFAPGKPDRKGGKQAQIALCDVDLAEELQVLTNVAGFRSSEIRVNVGGEFIGVVRIENRGDVISPAELRTSIATTLRERLLRVVLTPEGAAAFRTFEDLVYAQLRCTRTASDDEFKPALASVVVATLNRPIQLRRCLESLSKQVTHFPFEIIVVDNAPNDGMTAAVVREFDCARYVAEPLRGLAAARNTGFRAARGEILVATDDDVVAPVTWLQELCQPFRYAHVGVTTGQVLPLSLTHDAQRDFESLGGLGKGAISFEVGLDWLSARTFQPPRVWDLGATANAAFRRTVLQDPRVGLLAESLGPGTPAGGGEDVYLFYRALAAGYGVYYEAGAMVRHEHRSTTRELRRQMFDYGRGHVAYLLTTVCNHGDLRALGRLLLVLPAWHLWRLLAPAWRPPHKRRIVFAELCGYFSGPVAWILGLLRKRSVNAATGRVCTALPSP